ncbi:haloacid dehalogenase type II [Myceligenerans pegani]|uniref:Haloacid dehalogenase type II n=1 Tax=Myceligenerans pegani TaxID=2776917 RepID=A0ABR9MSU9_9MICO|nr:haloacid dehalogenase type II [Myceligenerans sp. TRM 65318]MBE1874136.1 haloacid dehalogenase type II [Myceligenerans sp. TRM 65318]MBE3016408.1 haloacid dehalogenase type II [Myceligenerans sp. TRM 65318]
MPSPPARPPRRAVVFDVLGTLVDQAGSLRDEVSEAAGADITEADPVVEAWLGHIARQEQAIVDGDRPFVPGHELDREALEWLAGGGLLPGGSIGRLLSASERLRPWPDSVAGLDLLSRDVTVMGLSNADRRTLAGLSGNGGLRWHQVLSAEDAGTYKPAPALYAMAMAAVPSDAGTPIMVAAHAWDLRAAAAAGMRTAYVPRPGGDAPRPGETFDLQAADLRELHSLLTRGE